MHIDCVVALVLLVVPDQYHSKCTCNVRCVDMIVFNLLDCTIISCIAIRCVDMIVFNLLDCTIISCVAMGRQWECGFGSILNRQHATMVEVVSIEPPYPWEYSLSKLVNRFLFHVLLYNVGIE